MNHDVFISYSRKDKEQAEALCKVLSAAGVKYWIDLSIGGSTNFLTEITRRIKACKTLIFIASANSAASEFTQKEILYAIKHKKPILPYKIGDFQFEDNDELDFIFTNVQWVESLAAVVSALNDMGLTNKATSEVVVPKPQPATKTYKVGDFYDDGTKRGVVFEVTPDGQHGKIVSLEQTQQRWSNEYEWTGATSRTDGMANMRAIQTIGGWRKKYPAFDWCADMGDGCYLPAIEELRQYTLNKDIRMKVNQMLSQYNELIQDYRFYWSSTEYNNFCAEGVDRGYGDVDTGGKDNWSGYVRYVAKF